MILLVLEPLPVVRTSSSITLLAKCAVGLSKEMLRISGVETKLMEKHKLTDAVRNYLNHEEDEVVPSNRWSKIQQLRMSIICVSDS